MFLVLFILKIPFSFAEAHIDLPHDGVVRFYVDHLEEFAEFHYLDAQGNWIDSVYAQINQIMRSRADQATIKMDQRLIELADHLQDHFGVDAIEVICGFRSVDFNKSLKATGHHVANESLHTKGLAMDIHIDEVKEDTLRDYLLKIKLGGVGYYGNKLMVHMDFGAVRQWQDGGFVNNTAIGIFNDASAAVLKTDQLFYDLDSGLILSVSGLELPGTLHLQRFFRGKWQESKSVSWPESFKPVVSFLFKNLVDDPVFRFHFGKFRFRYESKGTWQNSNEFYIKKI